MNSYVAVGVQIVMGLNPYLEEENRNLLQFCIITIELYGYVLNIARCIANYICQAARKLESHCTLQILNE